MMVCDLWNLSSSKVKGCCFYLCVSEFHPNLSNVANQNIVSYWPFLRWIVDQKVSKKCHFTWISRSLLAGGSLESSRVPHCWTEPSVINRTWLITWSLSAWFINSLTVFVCYCWHSNPKTKRFVEGSIKREMRGVVDKIYSNLTIAVLFCGKHM